MTRRDSPSPAPGELLASELVGLKEIHREFGVPLGSLHTWRLRGVLPQPIAELAMGPIYDRRDIQEWWAERQAKEAS